MLLPLLQIAIVSALLVYFIKWRRNMRRRNMQSWDGLLCQLRSDWSARELSEQFLWKEGLTATTDDIWQRLDGPKGLWAIYQNARVLLEMADYANRNMLPGTEAIDPMVLETLRSDAMQIRLCVLMALGQYAFRKANSGVKVNAFRAADMYSGMAARMTCLLQNHAAVILPDFVAAM
jgi:hypothetical protein